MSMVVDRAAELLERFNQLERARDRAGVRMISGYRGATDYEWRGVRYEVRHQAFGPEYYGRDVYHGEIVPMVGCIRCDGSPGWESFPPAELCELFPDYIPMRIEWIRGGEYRTHYKDGREPDRIQHRRSDLTYGWIARHVAEYNVVVLGLPAADYGF